LWTIPTLREVRAMIRDDIASSLNGVVIGNSVLRVLADADAAMGHLVLRYIDWLSRQFLPDTAETEWLDRHGDIWLVNSDFTVGRKNATLASGAVTMTGIPGQIVPSGTTLLFGDIIYETTEQITLGAGETEIKIRATTSGSKGNVSIGSTMNLTDSISGIDDIATVSVDVEGGTDEENDDDLRARVLFRIQQPPMGGDANDYVAWALAVPGVTRAWCSVEMGIGTVTVRFMMDELRAESNGFPNGADIQLVSDYLHSQRPVSVKDLFVVAPVPEPVDFSIAELNIDDDGTRAAIEVSVRSMLRLRGAPAHQINGVQQPAQMIFAAWVSEAISQSAGVESFTLDMSDKEMPFNGSLAVLGTIVYDNT
jgi:uncharacterized phage protein gp47/JayE